MRQATASRREFYSVFKIILALLIVAACSAGVDGGCRRGEGTSRSQGNGSRNRLPAPTLDRRLCDRLDEQPEAQLSRGEEARGRRSWCPSILGKASARPLGPASSCSATSSGTKARRSYKMWIYRGHEGYARGQHSSLYATSKDGIHWHKPLDLGIVKYNGSGANNMLLRNSSVENVIRRDDLSDPEKRYQFFTFDRNINSYAWRFSADGIHWGKPRAVPLLQGMYDGANVAYDETREIYVMAVKATHSSTYVHPVLGKHPQVYFRHWHMTTSKDTVNWTPLVDMLGDFDELDKTLYMKGEHCTMLNDYGVSLYAYHGVYLGIQWMFRITDATALGGLNGGPMDGRLVFSREWNKPWQIPTREFMIPHGNKGEWDWGMICGVANRPVVSPDGKEWWYYYGGWDGDHGIVSRRACIGLAKFRVDGFASIDSLGTEGSFTTPALKFTGGALKLNVDATGADVAGAKNYVRVELLDAGGKPLKGFSKSDCDPIHDNDVNRTVTWKGKNSVSELAGKIVRMKIYVRGAEVYAFQFVKE